MKERLKELRTALNLTQQEFADRIGIQRGTYAKYEVGRNDPIDAVIRLICQTFNVNEEWLRTGIGEMFVSSVPAVDKYSIGGRMKDVRKRAGLTQAEFGDRIGFHKNQVYNVETGKSIPSDDYISSVALKFQVSVNWLKTGEGEKSAVTPEIDDRLLEWLKNNPDVIRELRLRGGLD